MGDGQAGERTGILAAGEARIDRAGVDLGLLEGLRDDRVDGGVRPFDLCDVRTEHVERGDLARADAAGKLDGGEEAEFGHVRFGR